MLKTAEVELDNETIKIDISKTDMTGVNELEGATLGIFEDGKDVALITWISDGKKSKRIEIGYL